MVLGKHEIEAALATESKEIQSGRLKEDNPLDSSTDFRTLCEACRRGDLKVCQEKIQEGVNINARDHFDYTPLILASLCGHFEVVQLLLESGALCERDTFQGERCLYNALNDKIRNLLLAYDYSKSRDPLQPLAGHITALLSRDTPQTSDITLVHEYKSYKLHKFILAARSPYFFRKLAAAPDTTTWRVPSTIPLRSFDTAILALYFTEISADFSGSEVDKAVLAGIAKLGRLLEIGQLFETLLESDRRLARQRRSEEVERGRGQLEEWFRKNVLAHQLRVETAKVESVKWDSQNSIFADVLLCADDSSEEDQEGPSSPQTDISTTHVRNTEGPLNGIPIGPFAVATLSTPVEPLNSYSILIPAHKAMLLRSEYFLAMFSSPFREAQPSTHLPIIRLDCSPAVLEIVLCHIYTERCTIPLQLAVDVLFTADQLFIEKLKVQAATIISTLGNGGASVVEAQNPRGEIGGLEDEVIDVYDVVRAGWLTRVHRLEEFGARYLAYRLERYIDEDDFKELVKESAARITQRQETDTVELIDDIRFYLSERFRLRFEDAGIDELMEEDATVVAAHTARYNGDENFREDRQSEDVPEVTTNGSLAHVATQAATGGVSDVHLVDGVIRTLDGEIAGDEFASDALNYQILLGKIDTLLENLKLDA